MFRLHFLLLALLYFLPNSVNSQTVKSNSILDYSIYSLQDLYKAPSNWDGKDYVSFGLSFSVFTLAYTHDREIMDFIQSQKGNFSNKLAFVGEKWGNGAYVGGIYATVGLASIVFPEKEQFKEIFHQGSVSALYTSVVIMGLKHLIQRKRPHMTQSPYDFGSVLKKPHYHSLPSGHTAMAFSLASVIEMNTNSKVLGFLAYSMAGVTAWSRMHDHKHWASDVLMGAVLGTVVSRSVIDSYKKRKP
jgi:hypothetical protein